MAGAGWSIQARAQAVSDAAGCLHNQSDREDARRQKASMRTTTGPGSGSLTIIPARSPKRVQGVSGKPGHPVHDQETIVDGWRVAESGCESPAFASSP